MRVQYIHANAKLVLVRARTWLPITVKLHHSHRHIATLLPNRILVEYWRYLWIHVLEVSPRGLLLLFKWFRMINCIQSETKHNVLGHI